MRVDPFPKRTLNRGVITMLSVSLAFFFQTAILLHAEDSDPMIYQYKVPLISGEEKSLEDYRGKVLLIVNTASKCGFTGQYAGLQKLYEEYKGRGFEVLGFPANNFLGQEPGSNEEIKKFCNLKYGVSFPLFSKISVKGKDIHPLYAYLTKESPFPGDISWNFNKFLISPDGNVVARFDSKMKPDDPKLVEQIEALLPA